MAVLSNIFVMIARTVIDIVEVLLNAEDEDEDE